MSSGVDNAIAAVAAGAHLTGMGDWVVDDRGSHPKSKPLFTTVGLVNQPSGCPARPTAPAPR